MTQDIKHAVIDKGGYPYWPFALTLSIKKNFIQMHDWQWNGSFITLPYCWPQSWPPHHPSVKMLEDSLNAVLSWIQLSLLKRKPEYCICSGCFLILWLKAPLAWLTLTISSIYQSTAKIYFILHFPGILGISYLLLIELHKISIMGSVLQVTSKPILEFI